MYVLWSRKKVKLFEEKRKEAMEKSSHFAGARPKRANGERDKKVRECARANRGDRITRVRAHSLVGRTVGKGYLRKSNLPRHSVSRAASEQPKVAPASELGVSIAMQRYKVLL